MVGSTDFDFVPSSIFLIIKNGNKQHELRAKKCLKIARTLDKMFSAL